MKKKYHFRNLTQKDLNFIRRIHISLLATPKDRVLRPWPDPKLEQTLPAPVSQAAMKAKPSDRTIMLFKSKKSYVEGKKYEQPTKCEHYVDLAALNAVASARIIKLSQPKTIRKVIKKPSKKTLLKRKKKFEKYKKERNAWLKARAAPKKKPQTPPRVEFTPFFATKRYEQLSPSQRLEKIMRLAEPPQRKLKLIGQVEKRPWSLSLVKPATDRVVELALPRRIPSETLRNIKYDPGKIPRNVLKAVASERTKALAAPRPRSKAVDNDLREDAFTIPPAALTYKASKRILELAKPRIKK